MKLFMIAQSVASVFVLAACSPKGKPPLLSPDGSRTLHTSVEPSNKDPTIYGCVIIEIRDKTGAVIFSENSHASAFHRWGISWISNDQFRLKSSDIGTSTWTRQSDGRWTKE